jgi:hypothetical protein
MSSGICLYVKLHLSFWWQWLQDLTWLREAGTLLSSKEKVGSVSALPTILANNCSPATPQAKWTHRDNNPIYAVRKRLLKR